MILVIHKRSTIQYLIKIWVTDMRFGQASSDEHM